MNVKYECEFCGRGFEREEDCKSHENCCSAREVKVRRISLIAECPVDLHHYVFNVDDEMWERDRLEYFGEDMVHSDEGCEDAGYEYVVYTTDLSKEHERALRLKLLDQALMELPCFIANYTQLKKSAEKLKKELE